MKLSRVSDIHTLPNGSYFGKVSSSHKFTSNAKEVIIKELFALGLHLNRDYETVADVMYAIESYKDEIAKSKTKDEVTEPTRTTEIEGKDGIFSREEAKEVMGDSISFKSLRPKPSLNVTEDIEVVNELPQPPIDIERVEAFNVTSTAIETPPEELVPTDSLVDTGVNEASKAIGGKRRKS